MDLPTKAKRELTDKQREAFMKATAKRRENIEARRKQKAEAKERNKVVRKEAYAKAKQIVLTDPYSSEEEGSEEPLPDLEEEDGAKPAVVAPVEPTPEATTQLQQPAMPPLAFDDEVLGKLAARVTETLWERLDSIPYERPPVEEEEKPKKKVKKAAPKKPPAKKAAVKKAAKKAPEENIMPSVSKAPSSYAPQYTVQFI